MSQVIVALDVTSRDGAHALVDTLGDAGDFYKVGLELFTRAGPQVVHDLRQRGKRVFLDLKLLDIPNTVAAAVQAASNLGVDLMTVHTVGGEAMLKGAVAAASEAAANAGRDQPTGLLGVTVLTSLSPSDVETAWGRSILSLRDEVVRLGTLAAASGLTGVVASVQEAQALRRALGSDFLIVTPGIRLAGGETHDQARVATPSEAVDAGADYLVVGRAVTAAPDPRRALMSILEELAPLVQSAGGAG